MIEIMTCIRGIQKGLDDFEKLSGWSLLKTKHPFAELCKKCLESTSIATNNDLLTAFGRISIFVDDLKQLKKNEQQLVFRKLKLDQTQPGARGIIAETNIARRLTQNSIEYKWSQKEGDPDFIIKNHKEEISIEVTSLQTSKEAPSLNYLIKNLQDRITEKSAKRYAGKNLAVIVDMTNYMLKHVRNVNHSDTPFIDSVNMRRYNIGAIIFQGVIIHTKSEGLFIGGEPAPTGYRVLIGWNKKYSPNCNATLKYLIDKAYFSEKPSRVWFSDITEF